MSPTGTRYSKSSALPVVLPRLCLASVVGIIVVIVVPAPALDVAIAVGGLLGVASIVDWIASVRPLKLEFSRSHPSILGANQEAGIRWTISNPTNKRVRVEFADEIVPSFRPGYRRAKLTVPSRGEAGVSTTLVPQRRGLFRFDGATVRVLGPLRLIGLQGYIHFPTEVRVYPSFGSKRKAELWIRRNRIIDYGLRSARFKGGGTEFDSMREYTEDDEYRHIDWAATARSSHSIVKTYRAEIDQRIVCVLDAGRIMAGTVDQLPRFEHALDALLMLVAVSTRIGDQTGLVVFNDQIRGVVPPNRSAGQLGRISESIYRIDPSLVESDYKSAFSFVLSTFSRRSMVVIFSELSESAVAQSLIPAISLISRDHVVVVAAVSDPQVAGWARESPAQPEAAFRKAAALSTLETRLRTSALLRAMGVIVVDETPVNLPEALADAYVQAKVTGRL